jgi:hypothetical protein
LSDNLQSIQGPTSAVHPSGIPGHSKGKLKTGEKQSPDTSRRLGSLKIPPDPIRATVNKIGNTRHILNPELLDLGRDESMTKTRITCLCASAAIQLRMRRMHQMLLLLLRALLLLLLYAGISRRWKYRYAWLILQMLSITVRCRALPLVLSFFGSGLWWDTSSSWYLFKDVVTWMCRWKVLITLLPLHVGRGSITDRLKGQLCNSPSIHVLY